MLQFVLWSLETQQQFEFETVSEILHVSEPYKKERGACSRFWKEPLRDSRANEDTVLWAWIKNVFYPCEEPILKQHIREFKHDIYGRRQTAKITPDFPFFCCNLK